MQTARNLADVALPVPVPHPFTYEVPDALVRAVTPGVRVVVAFGARRTIGVVIATRKGEPPARVKAVLSKLEGGSVPAELLAFLRELSSYYLAPIGEVVRLALPPVDRESARAVASPTWFGDGAHGLGERRVRWVVATDAASSRDELAGQAALLLAHVRAVGPTPLARLEDAWGNARGAVKKLVASGLVRVEERAALQDPFFAEPVAREPAKEPTEPQAEAISAIGAAISSGAPATFLLHGVTGSGKTEVYLRAIGAAKQAKKGAIVLVPEIALTPQLVGRFRARFGDLVAVLHSGLTPRERHTMWQRLRSGEVLVAIGARSALFAPVCDLGLIVVDEEHDPSFKQEEGIRYHARDMAILRAHRCRGVCVLGSATPSLESAQLSATGKLTKLVLPDRARAQAMPAVEVVDLRRIGPGPTGDKRLSLPLHRAIERTLQQGGQAILFLNRRGFAPSVQCESCGELWSCPMCSVALTFHKRRGAVVRCHYCDYEAPMLVACPKCSAHTLALSGLGTEKLEETLSAAFPTARVARLDRDVASGAQIERVLARVRAREIDLLVGTQMVTKGHDLPHVTLVGVINADAALSMPDFRASERAFQLLVQVAGRAGRGDLAGKVLIQTYDPEHPAISFAVKHDVNGFTKKELDDRRELRYPPFSRMALVRVDSPEENLARDACAALAQVARAAVAPGTRTDVIGPAPAPIARVRNRFRFRVMIRAEERAELRRTLLAVAAAIADMPRTVRASIDVDPVQLL